MEPPMLATTWTPITGELFGLSRRMAEASQQVVDVGYPEQGEPM